MRRRDFLRLGAGLSAAVVMPGQAAVKAGEPAGRVFVPGYLAADGYFEGQPARAHASLARGVPENFRGSVRMLTRLDIASGGLLQALFPVHGHDVAISPDGRIGFYGNLEAVSMVTFDPASLDVVAIGRTRARGWKGGGHGVFLDNRILAVVERAPRVGYRGSPEAHFGRVTLRDPETLEVIEDMSAHGVSPHEIRLLADGEHAAVANYGSTPPPGEKIYSVPRHIVEPSIAVVSLKSGRLVEKYTSGSDSLELRHLCLADREAIFAIQTGLGLPGADQAFRTGDRYAYEAELTGGDRSSYLPAPPVMVDRAAGAMTALGVAAALPQMRHGLSIEYDPEYNEVLATFPATHRIMVFDGTSGGLKRSIDCSAMGLDYPCGLIMLRDRRSYAVAGYWKNLFVLERGSHRVVRPLCRYTTFFGHSHMATG